MLNEFWGDLAKAQITEQKVLYTLVSLGTNYKFEWVGDQREYFHKGDIKATAPDGKEIFIDVKDDSRIHETKNILCEEENYFKDGDYYSKGNMYSLYDVLAVVSQKEQKIYFIDFHTLQQNYKKGIYKAIEHPAQTSFCYLCSIGQVKKWGAFLGVINF